MTGSNEDAAMSTPNIIASPYLALFTPLHTWSSIVISTTTKKLGENSILILMLHTASVQRYPAFHSLHPAAALGFQSVLVSCRRKA